MYDISSIRSQFPIFKRTIHGKPLVFLDSAASAQKPQCVIDAMSDVITNHYANINRGVYTLSEEATRMVEEVREKVRDFIHASSSTEIVFTKNSSESINLVAYSWGRTHVTARDIVVCTEMEHHSNIVPWQILCKEKGASLRYIGVTNDGQLDWEGFVSSLSDEDLQRIKLICVTHVSNVLGTINDIKEVTSWAHDHDVCVLVDGAQAIPQIEVNVSDLDVDFYVFSGHKIYGPTGIGVLYGKEDLLKAMPPFLSGGDMIIEVHKEFSTYQETPHKFEAGTPPIVEIIGLGAAIDFVCDVGVDSIRTHTVELVEYAYAALSRIDGLSTYGPNDAYLRGGVISFTMKGVHPHDIASILDEEGVAIRSGHHCAQLVCDRFEQSAMGRVSFGVYSTKSDVDMLVNALNKVKTVFKL